MLRLLVSLLLLTLAVWLGYFTRRADFASYLVPYLFFWVLYMGILAASGVGYRSLLFKSDAFKSLSNPRWQLGLGVALRVLLLFSLPNLSEDCYRFLWDGRLWAQGIHPFAHTPKAIMEGYLPLRGIDTSLFSLLNSANYNTIYPPVSQFVFWVVALCAPEDIPLAVLLLKTALFAGELLMLRLLYRQSPNHIGWWALNPLVLLEIMGNCHFEGLMATCMLYALEYLRRNKPWAAGIAWALAIATKLLPLLFVPLIWAWAGRKKSIPWSISAGLATVLLFWPLADWQVLNNMGSSLSLYFQQFEFNASFYYLAKFGGNLFAEWDTGRRVSPVLAVCTVAFVTSMAAYYAIRRTQGSPPIQEMLLWAASIYLLNATTVHPWYLLIPLAMSYGTSLRFPLVWSGVVALSYSHYIGGGLQEQYGLIAVEYGILLLAMLGHYREIVKT